MKSLLLNIWLVFSRCVFAVGVLYLVFLVVAVREIYYPYIIGLLPDWLSEKPHVPALSISYSALGWSKDGKVFAFLKDIDRFDDFQFGEFCGTSGLEEYCWVSFFPNDRKRETFLCTVDYQGKNLREIVRLPDIALNTYQGRELTYHGREMSELSLMPSRDALLLLMGQKLYRLSASGMDEIAKTHDILTLDAAAYYGNSAFIPLYSGYGKYLDFVELDLKTGVLTRLSVGDFDYPLVSPSGHRIAFQRRPEGSDAIEVWAKRPYEIVVFDLTSKNTQKVFEGIRQYEPGQMKWLDETRLAIGPGAIAKGKILQSTYEIVPAAIPGKTKEDDTLSNAFISRVGNTVIRPSIYHGGLNETLATAVKVWSFWGKRNEVDESLITLTHQQGPPGSYQQLFSLRGRRIPVSTGKPWVEVLNEQRSDDGWIW